MILRNKMKENFSSIPNEIIRNTRLSDKEYRLLMFLYSLPDDWEVDQSWLGREFSCSRERINKKLKKLKDTGYLKIKNNGNNFKYDYVYILTIPDMTEDDTSINFTPENFTSLNDTRTNTELTNTELTNNSNNKLLLVEQILDYMNKLGETSFKSTTKKTQKLINARSKEGFKLEDFKKVIYLKYKEWYENPIEFKNGVMSDTYFRPDTLFSTNFEGYLQEFSRKVDTDD